MDGSRAGGRGGSVEDNRRASGKGSSVEDNRRGSDESSARERNTRLRAALRDAVPTATDVKNRERRRYVGKRWRNEAIEFVRDIAATATLLQQASDASGQLVYRTDARYRMLCALERLGGDPSISELARVLRVSKQAARETVIAAARAGAVEILPDPFDRRSLRIALMSVGKRELVSAHTLEFSSVVVLLNGLPMREMRLVAHVLRVIRRRLLRHAGELQAPTERGATNRELIDSWLHTSESD